MIEPGEVHVVTLDLDQDGADEERFAALLSADERARSQRFRFARDRRRFIVGRGTLRLILGRYLGAQPARLSFRYGPHGKPALEGDSALRFNLSHSQGLALYALAMEHEVGVDMERIQPLPDLEDIARSCFAEGEIAALWALPEAQRLHAFFACWTRKEAFIKAIGDGLSFPLDRFDVSLVPGAPARLLRVEGDPGEASRWTLAALHPAPGYAAALAVRMQGMRPRCFSLSDAAFGCGGRAWPQGPGQQAPG
jgi:4'-phosphopantetheinyl transferase